MYASMQIYNIIYTAILLVHEQFTHRKKDIGMLVGVPDVHVPGQFTVRGKGLCRELYNILYSLYAAILLLHKVSQ